MVLRRGDHRRTFSGQRLGLPTEIRGLGAMVPWLSHVDAEDLYLPEDYLSDVRWSWNPDPGLLVEYRKSFIGPDEAPPQASRNGPCPCGSGKKYKRCCGADRD
jgi:hypothetical protein